MKHLILSWFNKRVNMQYLGHFFLTHDKSMSPLIYNGDFFKLKLLNYIQKRHVRAGQNQE